MTIESAMQQLLEFQETLNRLSNESWNGGDNDVPICFGSPDYCCSRLMVADLGGGLAVYYFGDDLLMRQAAAPILGKAEVAEHIVSLRIEGPDQGANGMREWEFDPILEAAPAFQTCVIFGSSQRGRVSIISAVWLMGSYHPYLR